MTLSKTSLKTHQEGIIMLNVFYSLFHQNEVIASGASFYSTCSILNNGVMGGWKARAAEVGNTYVHLQRQILHHRDPYHVMKPDPHKNFSAL